MHKARVKALGATRCGPATLSSMTSTPPPALRAVAAAFVLALSLAAIIAPANAQTQTTIRVNENAPGDTDPARSTRAVGSILFYNLYDTLLAPGPGGNGIVPLLAESFAMDGKAYTFKLRQGAKFHSGNELTADDVVYSLNRLIAIGAGPAPLFKNWVEKAEVLDKQTVRITTTQPYTPFLAATFRLGIIDSKLARANQKDGPFGEFGDYSQAFLVMNDAGTGAYRIVSHAPQTQTVLEKNLNYFLPISADAPDRVIMLYGVEQATQVAMMRRGELDIMSQWASPETKRAALGVDGVSIVGEAGLSALQIKLNTTKPPLDDVHCRRALAKALDYEALAGQANVTPNAKGATVTNGPLLIGTLGYDPSIPPYARDMQAAKAELDQ